MNSLEELFATLNNKCIYLILRNWEDIFSGSIYGNDHTDIDVLCEDKDSVINLLEARTIHDNPCRDNYIVDCGGRKVRFDIRWVGDGYYPAVMEKDMLDRRVLSEKGFYIPCLEDYFYSLSYHTFFQKKGVSKEYSDKLNHLYSELYGRKNAADVFKTLCSYLNEKKLKVEIPKDPGVYLNWNNIKQVGYRDNWCRLIRRVRVQSYFNSILRVVKSIYCYFKYLPLKKKINLPLLEEYLEGGSYRILYQSKLIIAKRNIPRSFIDMISKTRNGYFIGNISIKSPNDNPNKAQVAMQANKNIRIFNLKNGKTIHFIDNKSERDSLLKIVDLFSPFFKTPILSIEDGYSIEAIIENNPRKNWKDSDIINSYYCTLGKYIEYLHSMSEKGAIKNSYRDYPLPKEISLFPEYKEHFSIINNELQNADKIPVVFCHCDMHFGNILVSDKDLYLIDFEYAREELFFYDIFNILYVEFIDWHNSLLLDKYLDEDPILMNFVRRAFEEVGILYDRTMKLRYFEYYLLARLSFYSVKAERILNGKDCRKKIVSIIENIHRILNYIRHYDEKG